MKKSVVLLCSLAVLLAIVSGILLLRFNQDDSPDVGKMSDTTSDEGTYPMESNPPIDDTSTEESISEEESTVEETLTEESSSEEESTVEETPTEESSSEEESTVEETLTEESSSEEDNTVIVISLRNDDGTEIDTLHISKGDKIDRPQEPVRGGYKFIGWYSDSGCTMPFDFSKAITEDTAIYAKWNATKFCNIESIDIAYDLFDQSGICYINAGVSEACTILIRFIPEDSYFAEAYVRGECYIENAEIEVSLIPDEGMSGDSILFLEQEFSGIVLPNNFVVEAVALSGEGEIVSDYYVNIMYTERYMRFYSITVYDFSPDDTVIKFSGDDYDNFGVLSDNVKVITAESVSEVFHEGADYPQYYITSPSQNIALGDKLYVVGSDGEMLAIVDKVEKEGDTFIVTPFEVTEENSYMLSEFYKYLKVNMNVMGNIIGENEAVPATFAARNKSFDLPSRSLSYKAGNMELSKSIGGMVNFDISIQFASDIFGENYFSISFTCATEIRSTTSIGVTGEIDLDEKLNLSKLLKKDFTIVEAAVPVGVPGLFLFYELEFDISCGATGSYIGDEVYIYSTGFDYTTQNGLVSKESKEIRNTVIECGGEVYIKGGFNATVGCGYMFKLITLQLDRFIGLEVRAEVGGKMLTVDHGDVPDDHLCDICVEGGIYGVYEVEMSLNLNLPTGKNDADNIGKLAISHSWGIKLADFYVSIKSDSPFPKSGWGECPYRGIYVTIDIYPYFEDCYYTYDPITGEYTFGEVIPNGDYNLPISYGTIDEVTDSPLHSRFLYSFLTDSNNDGLYETGTTDEYGNTVYRVVYLLSEGEYSFMAFYGKEEVMYIDDTALGTKWCYKPKMGGEWCLDYGEACISISSEDIKEGKKINVKVYPTNVECYTKTYTFNVVQNVFDYETGEYNEVGVPDIEVLFEFSSYWYKSVKLEELNVMASWVPRPVVIYNATSGRNGIMHVTFTFMDIPGMEYFFNSKTPFGSAGGHGFDDLDEEEVIKIHLR